MIKLQLKPLGAATPIDVQLANVDRNAPHVYTFQRADQITDVVAEVDATGAGWMRLSGRVIPFYSARTDHHLDVWLDGVIHRFEVVERTARRATGAAVGGPKTTLNAPMPGTILKINVEVGDTFAASQALVIMESMKMEMTLSVPHGGRVTEITCRPGQLVDMGALLVKLEPAKGDSP